MYEGIYGTVMEIDSKKRYWLIKLISLFLGRKSILQSYVKDDADMNDIELQRVYVIDTAIDLDLFCMVGITNCTIR